MGATEVMTGREDRLTRGCCYRSSRHPKTPIFSFLPVSTNWSRQSLSSQTLGNPLRPLAGLRVKYTPSLEVQFHASQADPTSVLHTGQPKKGGRTRTVDQKRAMCPENERWDNVQVHGDCVVS